MTHSMFADDPAEYFNFRSGDAHGLTIVERETLQLDAVQKRFAEMRRHIAPLAALADAQSIEKITYLDDVPRLMFPHSIYKAYPEHLTVDHDFPRLTQWLSRFTLNDLSPVIAGEFETFDAWQDALDENTAIDIIHSSGTTGKMSFYPRGKKELALQYRHARMTMADWVEPQYYNFDKPGFTIVWTSYANGRSALLKLPRAYRNYYANSREDFYSLLPTEMSTDHQFYLMQIESSRANNYFNAPEPSAYVMAKINELAALYGQEQQRLEAMLNIIETELVGKRILLAGSPLTIYSIAKAGIERGMESAFAPGSALRSFGGLKGVQAAPDLQETLLKFSGVSQIKYGYGMTELSSVFDLCKAGRYHVPPWIIAYILDPLTGNPKAREGVQEGRGAFFDLVAQTYWGGVISADHLEISWNPCRCGRTSPHIKDDIKRVSDPEHREHYIGPAPASAVDAALAALSQGLE